MELQEQIQRRIQALVDSGAETGVQVAVYQDGELVVDAVAGTADAVTGRPLTSGTPIFSFSTGKNMSATLAHVLVARGYLEYDSLLTDVWPEFGVRGKASATLRHVLTHTVGLPAMPREITPRELPDWSRVCESLAAAEPRWQPGAAMGYHSYTFGYLVGELARRTTGQPMHELLHEWITGPLGVEGQLYFAVPEDSLRGLARLDEETWQPSGDGDAILAPWESGPSADFGNTADILRADVPSVGTATAHGLAAMYNAVLQGKLLDTERLTEVAFEGTDEIFGTPARMLLGYPLGRIGAPAEEKSAAFGWPGGGGSYAYADPARGVAFALTKTRLTPNFDTTLTITTLLADHLATNPLTPPPPHRKREGDSAMTIRNDDTSSAPQTILGPFSAPGATPTPWEETELALRRTQKFQLCTVRRDGRPHVTPLLAIWAHGAMWFTTGEQEQKAKNLAANQHCVLTAGSDSLISTDYVIEGIASLVTDEAAMEAALTAFEDSYGWQITREDGIWNALPDAVRSGNAQLYRVQPDKAFAFTTGTRSSQTRYLWT